VSDSVFHSLVVSLVMPRLDYCNATLAGLPASQLSRLQSVLNSASRLIHRSSRYEHVTPMLRDLHCLRSPERIDFKLAVLTYRCLHGLVPRYLSIIPRASLIPAAAVSGRRHPRNSTYTAVHCWWSCVSGCRMPLLEQSAPPPDFTSASRLSVFRNRSFPFLTVFGF